MQKRQLYSLFVRISKGDTMEVKRIFAQDQLHPEIILNAFEWTPLHTAAYKGHLELVKHFLDLGSRPHVKNQSGHTPLMLAQKNGHTDIVQLLASISDHKITGSTLEYEYLETTY